MAFETSLEQDQPEQSDLGLHISPTECIMSASSVNSALQNKKKSLLH